MSSTSWCSTRTPRRQFLLYNKESDSRRISPLAIAASGENSRWFSVWYFPPSGTPPHTDQGLYLISNLLREEKKITDLGVVSGQHSVVSHAELLDNGERLVLLLITQERNLDSYWIDPVTYQPTVSRLRSTLTLHDVIRATATSSIQRNLMVAVIVRSFSTSLNMYVLDPFQSTNLWSGPTPLNLFHFDYFNQADLTSLPNNGDMMLCVSSYYTAVQGVECAISKGAPGDPVFNLTASNPFPMLNETSTLWNIRVGADNGTFCVMIGNYDDSILHLAWTSNDGGSWTYRRQFTSEPAVFLETTKLIVRENFIYFVFKKRYSSTDHVLRTDITSNVSTTFPLFLASRDRFEGIVTKGMDTASPITPVFTSTFGGAVLTCDQEFRVTAFPSSSPSPAFGSIAETIIASNAAAREATHQGAVMVSAVVGSMLMVLIIVVIMTRPAKPQTTLIASPVLN